MELSQEKRYSRPQEKWPEHFAKVEKVWELLPSKIEFDPSNALQNCLVAAYEKQHKIYYASYKLCELGLGKEAAILDRTMYEIWLLLQKLEKSENPLQFAEDWLVWGHVNDYNRLLHTIKLHPKEKANDGIIKYQSFLEDKIKDVKARWESKLEESKKICPKCGYGEVKIKSKWDQFQWKGPALVGPTRLSRELGQPLIDFYSEKSGAVNSYDIHSYAYAVRSQSLNTILDDTEGVLEEIIVWMVSAGEIINRHVPLGDKNTWLQLIAFRESILLGTEQGATGGN